MWQYNNTNELYHFGIPGMRWGHRKQYTKNTGNSKKVDRIKKTMKIATAAAAIAVGAYLVKKYIDKNADITIKPNIDIQSMRKNTEHSLDRTFYATYKKSDNKKYSKGEGTGVDKNWNVKQIITSTKGIKVAGKKQSIDTFKQWAKNNDDYKKYYNDYKPVNDNTNKKELKKAYDWFIKDAPMTRPETANKYFKELSKKGYQATRDTYDQKIMKAKSPIIIFDGFENLKTKSIKKIK